MDEQYFADPLNEKIKKSDFLIEQRSLIEKVENLKNYNWPFLLLILAAILPVAYIIISIYLKNVSIELLIYSFVPLVTHYVYITSLQNQVMLYLLCEQHGWGYNPKESTARAQKFIKSFPDIFQERDELTFLVTNQIWGKVNQVKQADFWFGTFFYRDNSGKKSFRSGQSVFIIKLDKVLPVEFTLYRHDHKSKIKTESEAFNKLFTIVPEHIEQNTTSLILQILSPSVQVRLTDFADNFSANSITFRYNAMFVITNRDIWKTKYTNFFNRVMIDERDVQRFDNLMNDMTALPAEMIQFLD